MVVTVPDLESMIDKVDVTVKENLQKKFRGTALNYGKNLLLVNVACIMIKNFLKSEIRQLEELAKSGLFLTITMLEQRLRRSILIQSGGENIQVLIQGVADRIDHIGNETRILDYKTGMVEKKELLMKDWNELLEDPRLDKSFQLITYAWMLAEFPNTLPLLTGIIPMKKPANGVMAVQVQHNQLQKPEELLGESDLAAFESVLKELLSGIFDFKVPFCQTSSTDHCAFCPYTVICGR